MLSGITAGDESGSAVSSAGDVNGDGIKDLLIGAPGADPDGKTDAGQTYVVFGRPLSSPFPSALELSSLDGTNGFVLNGVAAGDKSGSRVSGVGDIDGDGLDDFIIGTPDAGRNYVVFGRPSSSLFPAALELSSLDGTDGFVLDGIGINFSKAGDVNGDGIHDLILGMPAADPNGKEDAGQSYVVFGRPSSFPFPALLKLSSLDGTNGFVLNGIAAKDFSGSVSAAGDVNGDGIDDILIGAFMADPNGKSSAGQSYVVFGRRERQCADDVTNQIRITRGPILFEDATQLFVQRVKLTNISSSVISGPAYLVLDNLGSRRTRLANQNGVTECAAPLGSPFRKTNLGLDNALSPGEYGVVILRFRHPVPGAITSFLGCWPETTRD